MSITRKHSGGVGLYERMGERTTQPFALQVLGRLKPLQELSVIDVAAGTGGLAVAASEQGASVLATDKAPAMVDRIRERLQNFQQSRAEIMDFLDLTPEDDSFDTAISNFGILAYPQWQAALDEMVRVIRPGGSVALTMWTNEDDCSPAHLLHRVFRRLFPDRDLWQAGLFPIFSHASLSDGLVKAGCVGVTVETVGATWSPYSSDDVVDECGPMFTSFRGYADLSDNERSDLHSALKVAFDTYADHYGTVRLPTRAFLVVAKKPIS